MKTIIKALFYLSVLAEIILSSCASIKLVWQFNHPAPPPPPISRVVSDTNSVSYLLTAAYFGNIREVEKILDRGVDVNIWGDIDKYRKNYTPLLAAYEGRQRAMIELLVLRHADVNLTRPGDNSILASAMWDGSPEAAKYFLNNGAKFDKQTVLNLAVKLKDFELVKLLVDKGAEIFPSRDSLGTYVLTIAWIAYHNDDAKNIANEDLKIIRYLYDNGARLPSNNALLFTEFDWIFKIDEVTGSREFLINKRSSYGENFIPAGKYKLVAESQSNVKMYGNSVSTKFSPIYFNMDFKPGGIYFFKMKTIKVRRKTYWTGWFEEVNF